MAQADNECAPYKCSDLENFNQWMKNQDAVEWFLEILSFLTLP